MRETSVSYKVQPRKNFFNRSFLETATFTLLTHCHCVTGDFFRGSFRQNHVPWGRLSLWKWVTGISPGVKAAGAYGWRPRAERRDDPGP